MDKKYSVCLVYYALHHVEVTAENEEAAIDKAIDNVAGPSVCHQCSHEIEIGELAEDGHFAERID